MSDFLSSRHFIHPIHRSSLSALDSSRLDWCWTRSPRHNHLFFSSRSLRLSLRFFAGRHHHLGTFFSASASIKDPTTHLHLPLLQRFSPFIDHHWPQSRSVKRETYSSRSSCTHLSAAQLFQRTSAYSVHHCWHPRVTRDLPVSHPVDLQAQSSPLQLLSQARCGHLPIRESLAVDSSSSASASSSFLLGPTHPLGTTLFSTLITYSAHHDIKLAALARRAHRARAALPRLPEPTDGCAGENRSGVYQPNRCCLNVNALLTTVRSSFCFLSWITAP